MNFIGTIRGHCLFLKESLEPSFINSHFFVIQTSALIVFLSVLIGRAKRAPHWGVQSRFRVIYMSVSQSVDMSVVSKKIVGGITWPKNYDTCVIHFYYKLELL